MESDSSTASNRAGGACGSFLVARHGPLDPPQPSQIISGGRQSYFHGHLRQAPQAEAAQAALFFQHPEDRLDDRFTSLIDGAPTGAPQPLAHASLLGMMQTAG